MPLSVFRIAIMAAFMGGGNRRVCNHWSGSCNVNGAHCNNNRCDKQRGQCPFGKGCNYRHPGHGKPAPAAGKKCATCGKKKCRKSDANCPHFQRGSCNFCHCAKPDKPANCGRGLSKGSSAIVALAKLRAVRGLSDGLAKLLRQIADLQRKGHISAEQKAQLKDRCVKYSYV